MKKLCLILLKSVPRRPNSQLARNRLYTHDPAPVVGRLSCLKRRLDCEPRHGPQENGIGAGPVQEKEGGIDTAGKAVFPEKSGKRTRSPTWLEREFNWTERTAQNLRVVRRVVSSPTVEPETPDTRINSMDKPAPSASRWGYVAGYLALWIAAVCWLRRAGRLDAPEIAAAFVLLGIVFPALAVIATRHAKALPYPIHRSFLEALVSVFYLVPIAVVLVYGFDYVARITAEPSHLFALTALKLATFVIIPAIIIKVIGGYRIGDMVPLSLRWKDLRPALWMSLVILLFQAVFGRGLRDIHGAHLSPWVVTIALPLSFLWLLLEVGLVEEFFFRTLLQTRLEAALRSATGGLIVSSLLFGLVHAPGFFLRTTATLESLGPHPSVLTAVAFSIALTSLAGLFMGVLWIRTNNFAVVAIVHAVGDLLPNLVPWVKVFHLR